MDNEQLREYIKNQQAQGYAPQLIKESLLKQGWNQLEVEETFNSINDSENNSSKRKVFFWMIGIICLVGVLFVIFLIYESTTEIDTSKIPGDSSGVVERGPIEGYVFNPNRGMEQCYELLEGTDFLKNQFDFCVNNVVF